MDTGRIVGEFERGEATSEKIMACILKSGDGSIKGEK
jgi:hypothetical protein